MIFSVASAVFGWAKADPIMSKYYSKLIMALTLVLAGLLRFVSPWSYPTIAKRDYWYDEAFTGILLKQGWASMNDMIFRDVHPPLYYWLSKLWAAPFGYSPFGIRSFSAVLGLVSVLSIYWIGKKMFSERTGILAAIITAFSPFAIEYSQEARMYALFGLLMIWAVYFFHQALSSGKMKDWVLWGIFGGLSFYTHYLALFFFVFFYVAFVVYRWMNQEPVAKDGEGGKFAAVVKNWGKLLFASKGFWIGTGIIIVFFLSWIKIFIAHITKGNLSWIEPAQFSDIPKTLQIFFFGHPAGTGGVPWANPFRYFFDGTSVGLVIFTLIVVLFTIALLRKIHVNELVLLVTLSFGTLLFLVLLSHGIDGTLGGKQVTFSIKLYVARYFMPAALFIFLLTAALVEEVINRRGAWLVFLGVYVLLLLLLKPLDFASGWNMIYESREALFGSDKLIVTANPFDYTTARYYFGQERVRLYNKNNPTESFAGWVVVGDDNKINDIDEIKDNSEKYFIIDDNCDWKDLKLSQYLLQADNKAICRVTE